MKYLFVLILTMFSSSNALAECGGVACNDVKLTMVYVASGKSYIQTNGNETLLTNCQPLSGKFLSLDHTHSSADKCQ